MRNRYPNAIVRWWQRITAPVPQDTSTIRMGFYRDHTVMLRPVMSPVRPWIVLKWIPDPDQKAEVDRILDSDNNESRGTVPAEGGMSDSEPPADFNPAGCAML